MNKRMMALAAALWLATAAPNSAQATIPLNAQLKDQSAFALGTLDLNVIFVESDGSIDPNQEDWTSAQRTEISGEIDEAVRFWEGLTSSYHPNAQLDIRVNYVNGGVPMTTSYEPITRPSTGDSIWINEIMNDLGFHNRNKLTNVRDFNQSRRIEADTNWATTMFIVNDFVDEDNRFANSFFAYSHIGGPFMTFTYANNGWRPDRFNQVLSHELGHVFFALDEYALSGARTTQRSGYLDGLNGNAERDGNGASVTSPQPNALMLNNTLDPSPFTLAHIGIVDTDNDSIPDILDTTPQLTGDALQSDQAAGTFVFAGSASVTPLNNLNQKNLGFTSSGADMTINWIDAAQYNLDQAGWQSFDALDGVYDGYTEPLQLTLDGLIFGDHQISIRVSNSVGNSSQSLDFIFSSTNVPEPSAIALFGLGLLLAWRRRWL